MGLLNRLGRVCVIAGAALVLLPAPSFAQGLEEILVTATKREESLQDIPLSVATVSGEALQAQGIDDLFDLSKSIPNFDVAFNVTSNAITMRGFGSGQERSFEQSVGMFIDGQYLPRSRQYRAPFMDAQRVEIVRGPQAVLFGINSTAGAVSIVSNRSRPGDEFMADVSVDTELEYGGFGFETVVGGSLSDTLGVRLALQAKDYDGYYENTSLGDENDIEQTVVRLSAVWEPMDNLSIDAKFELADYETSGNTGEIYGPVAQIVEAGTNDGVIDWRRGSEASFIDPFGVFQEGSPGDYGELQNTLVKLDYDLGNQTITALAGHSKFDWDYVVDLDTSAAPILDAAIDEDYEQSSLEVRLASNDNDQFNYIIGAYYHTSKLFNAQPNIINGGAFVPGLPPVLGTSFYTLDADHFSVFAHGTWEVNDTVTISGGLRSFSEDKDVLRNRQCGALITGVGFVENIGLASALGVCPNALSSDGFTAGRSSDDVMPEIAVQWDWTESTMVYFKYGQSTKAGGFAADTNVSPGGVEFDDETSQGFEAGLKARIGDNAEVNVALFTTEFEDLQVRTTALIDTGMGIQTSPVVTNVGEATSQGLEVDARWAANEWLTVGGSIAFLDAEYDSFATSNCNSVQVPDANGICDSSGMPLPFAADYSGNLYGDIAVPITPDVNFIAGLTIAFRDGYFTDPSLEPTAEIDSWTRMDARVGVAASDGRWDVALVGRNLGEEEIFSSQPLLGYIIGYVEPPRQIYLSGRYRFGN